MKCPELTMAMSVTVNARAVLVLMIQARIHGLSEPARDLGAEVANLVALPGRARIMVTPSHPRPLDRPRHEAPAESSPADT